MKKKGIAALVSTGVLAGVAAVSSVGVAMSQGKNNSGDLPENNQETPTNYTVRFDSRGGNLDGSSLETVTSGGQVSAPEVTRNGYEFLGWYSDENCTVSFDFNQPLEGSITLYAKWGIKHTVEFNTLGGSTVEAARVADGNSVTEPTTPTKDGHTFRGWYTDENCTDGNEYNFDDEVTGDLTLYAKWEINHYTVTFNVMEGDVDVPAASVVYRGTVNNPTPTYEGYTFKGWYSNPGRTQLYDFDSLIIGDIELYAKWEINKYNVTFDSRQGSTVNAQTITHGATAAVPQDSTRDNCTFMGWYADLNDAEPYDFSTPVTDNLTLYAKWNITVAFDSMEGTGVSSQNIVDGDTVIEPNTTREGYTFQAWCTDAECQNVYDFATAVRNPMTLYAKWQINTYDVAFETNCNSSIATQHIDYLNTVEQPTVNRDGCTLIGWYTDAGFQNEFNFATGITDDITLYAKWSINVVYNTCGGNEIATAQVVQGNTANNVTPTFTGCQFMGWYTDADYQTAYNFNTPVTQPITLYAKWSHEFTAINGGYKLTNYCGTQSSVSIPSTYNGQPVTTIGANVFANNTTMQTINIPNSITTIEAGALAGCTGLTVLNIPASVTTMGANVFNDCTNLAKIHSAVETQPDGWDADWLGKCTVEVTFGGVCNPADYTMNGTQIKKYNGSDENIIIPDGVTAIGSGAFGDCTNLISVTIPDSVKTISDSAFMNCTHLMFVNISDGVTTIGNQAFQGCTGLTEINIPDTVTSIGYYVFKECTNLTSITIPDGVTTIGECAFAQCTSLVSVNIEGQVSTIGNSAFSGCSSLVSIILPNSVAVIGSSAFAQCTSLTSINIPDNVTEIQQDTFYFCTNLISITIPNGVTTIHGSAFWGCTSLISINIPSSVVNIYREAFRGCTSLTSVVIPNNVTSVGQGVFKGCTNLKAIYIEASNIKYVSSFPGWWSSWSEGWYGRLYKGLNVTWQYDANGNPELIE